MAPHRTAHRLVDRGNVVLVGPLGDLHGGGATQGHQLQALDDVVCEDLHREVRARTVTGAVVRRRHGEQVGEPGHRSTAVSAWTVTPFVGQLLTATAADVECGQEVEMVAGGIDDDIKINLPT